jgi:hypothetical protein
MWLYPHYMHPFAFPLPNPEHKLRKSELVETRYALIFADQMAEDRKCFLQPPLRHSREVRQPHNPDNISHANPKAVPVFE